jgi:FkbM family methyltransferase
LRRSAVDDCRAVLSRFGIDPSESDAIDVGGTPVVYLDDSFQPNPLLELNPTIVMLDRGFNVEQTRTSADYLVDFLDPDAIAPLEERFDLAFNFDTLEHVSQPFSFAENLIRILKPGGHLFVATVFSWPYHPSPEDYFRYSPAGLQELFTSASNRLSRDFTVLWCGWGTDSNGVALLGGRKSALADYVERATTFEPIEAIRPGAAAPDAETAKARRRLTPRRVVRGIERRLTNAERTARERTPRLVRLPFGALSVSWGDVMGGNLRSGDYEEGERRFVEWFLEPGMTMVDVGAHGGFYTLLAARQVGAQGHVVAFEPSPRERRRLLLNLRLNRARNVVVSDAAVGARSGRSEFFVVAGRQTGFNSIRLPGIDQPVRRLNVPLVTLDGYLMSAGVESVDLVKLDVEGGELDVLRGSPRVFESRPRPIVLCEVSDARTTAWGYRASDIYDFLAEAEYSWFSTDTAGRLHACKPRSGYHENLVAVPPERLNRVAARIVVREAEGAST